MLKLKAHTGFHDLFFKYNMIVNAEQRWIKTGPEVNHPITLPDFRYHIVSYLLKDF
jgi:hypothetical protein